MVYIEILESNLELTDKEYEFYSQAEKKECDIIVPFNEEKKKVLDEIIEILLKKNFLCKERPKSIAKSSVWRYFISCHGRPVNLEESMVLTGLTNPRLVLGNGDKLEF